MTTDPLEVVERYSEDVRLTAARKKHRDRCLAAQCPSDFDEARRELLDTIREINNGSEL